MKRKPVTSKKSKAAAKPAPKTRKVPLKKSKPAPKAKIIKRPILKKKAAPKTRKITPMHLERSENNPILKPSHYPNWESVAAFNPSAIVANGKIHIIYRAIGIGDVSVLGHAESNDGTSISRRTPMPVYHQGFGKDKKDRSLPQIAYVSGGGWSGGCEDPRLTLIDREVYMLYTAFDGWGSVRIAMTHISLDDFISNQWNWKKPVLISAPGEVQKNWVLFPEKIKGKYALLHAISPSIMIDYIEDLDDFDGKKFIKSLHQDSPLWAMRDRGIRGVGPAPIKTKYGWLVLYHAMEAHDPNRYKLFAMILDLKDPTKILYRSKEAILSPDEWYENNGHKWGVIYSCGAVVKDGNLFVYYGGADMVSCVAMADLDKFLKELTKGSVSKLTAKVRSKK